MEDTRAPSSSSVIETQEEIASSRKRAAEGIKDAMEGATEPASKKVKSADENDKKKKGKENYELYQYGNYKRYYGYRQKNDERMAVFKREWFEGKTCLDIGCNTGKVTMDVARRMRPDSMLGIDIDSSLIEMAERELRNKRDKSMKKKPWVPKDFPISLKLTYGPIGKFPDNVSFRSGNIVDMQMEEKQQYDLVSCLSTTKWIHLNWGDEGVRKLFHRIWNLLRPGGYFLLEPQLFKSYKKKGNHLTKEIRENLQNIQFKPEDFIAYLTQPVQSGDKSDPSRGAFELKETIQLESEAKGFQRPLYLLVKRGSPQK
eukprot:TRINITY_DN5419_c0_g1_i1.p1 TRINITY_DN5419_c0_g1~~TRINITY_DN5419_c0_g1_i1.p1  ORF type:complete len:315 (+),score=81.78 TRINITY_DN5419_c0_g1_i1:116-1060(+)